MDLFNAVKCQKTESVKVFMTHIISKESNEEHSTINLLMEAIQFFGFPMLLKDGLDSLKDGLDLLKDGLDQA